MKNELLYSVMEDVQFVDIMTADIIEDGATWESYKLAFKTDVSKIKSAYREANELYRNGNKSKALVKIKEAKEGYQKIYNNLNNIEDTFWGNVCGYLVGSGILSLFANINLSGSKGALEWGKSYLLRLLSSLTIGQVAPSAGPIMGDTMKILINQNKGIPASNILKSDLMAAIKEHINMCNKLETAIKNDK